MDSIGDLLSKRQLKKPDEIEIIKSYAKEQFDESVKISVSERTIIIAVGSAPFAATLRHHLVKLQNLTQTQKKIVIRIV